MTNHLADILSEWFDQKDQTQWVLGTVYQTEGSSYRKAGAMMLFSGMGHQLGMLSGGCLENDILKHARRVMLSGQSTILTYDGNDEDDITFQLGIGCGGVVHIILQPVSAENDYLQLDKVCKSLREKHSGVYIVDLDPDRNRALNHFEQTSVGRYSKSAVVSQDGGRFLTVPVRSVNHLLIVGGGVDARPLARMAREIGWQVSVWDSRPANARPEFFETANHLIRGSVQSLADHVREQKIQTAVIMSHSVSIDTEALALLSHFDLEYVALLGPTHRRKEVLEKAGVNARAQLRNLAGPAGLDLGGELPEVIALSILAECQAVLNDRSGQSLSLPLGAFQRVPALSAVSHKGAREVTA